MSIVRPNGLSSNRLSEEMALSLVVGALAKHDAAVMSLDDGVRLCCAWVDYFTMHVVERACAKLDCHGALKPASGL